MAQKLTIVLLLFYLFNAHPLHASITPVPLEQRVNNAEQIVLARLNHQVSYWGKDGTSIYTLYVMDVAAYLKGKDEALQVALISEGGRIGQAMQVTFPRVDLGPKHNYLVFLNEDGSLPSAAVALPCTSRSIRSVGPRPAKLAARLVAMVDLPTPPLILATRIVPP